MLAKAGERIPLACESRTPMISVNLDLLSISDRCSKMLIDTMIQTCGAQEVESPPATLPPRDTTYLDSQYDYTAMLFSYKTPELPPRCAPAQDTAPVSIEEVLA